MRMNRKSIKWKILLSFLIIYLIAIIGLAVFYRASMDNVRSSASDSLETVLYQQKENAYDKLTSAEEFTLLVSKDSDLQNVLREELPEDEKDHYSQRLEYNSRLLAMNQYEADVLGCYVIGENGMYFKSSTNSWEEYADFWSCEWYQTAIETRESLWISHQDGSFLVNDLDTPVLTLVMPIQDRASTKILGVVVTDILAEDEIGSLGEHFNDMICQVNDLMEQEKENQDKLRKAELKALQAQINPHFLSGKRFKNGRGFICAHSGGKPCKGIR